MAGLLACLASQRPRMAIKSVPDKTTMGNIADRTGHFGTLIFFPGSYVRDAFIGRSEAFGILGATTGALRDGDTLAGTRGATGGAANAPTFRGPDPRDSMSSRFIASCTNSEVTVRFPRVEASTSE